MISDDGLAPGTGALAAAIREDGGTLHVTIEHSWSMLGSVVVGDFGVVGDDDLVHE
ncbi:MAG: hypothetical protein KKA44_17645 [Alphaproteobacteria bacterium]|nr:hypothetical protein [Alphaproteobacteria bacterium]MBU0863857.1 hypothetical protein [Alphaproteobacteria bacterium]MBU1826777.1 hypothetical protein [Alphaproteobacteria bacterium]